MLNEVPPVKDLQSEDPLKISKVLVGNKNIEEQVLKEFIKPKHYNQTIKEGVNSNYYKDKIQLENRPTIYDS